MSSSRQHVADLVEELVAHLSLMAKKKEIQLQVEVSGDLYFNLDRHIFLTVLRNLMNNAIKFTPHQGVVIVRVEQNTANHLQVAVVDNGVGISKERQRELLHLSNNNSRSGTDGEQGTGLGLILCQELITIHHGELSIASEEGRGSTFQFKLPSIEVKA